MFNVDRRGARIPDGFSTSWTSSSSTWIEKERRLGQLASSTRICAAGRVVESMDSSVTTVLRDTVSAIACSLWRGDTTMNGSFLSTSEKVCVRRKGMREVPSIERNSRRGNDREPMVEN